MKKYVERDGARRVHLDVGDGLPLCGSAVNGPTLSSERVVGMICWNCQRDPVTTDPS